MNKKAICNLAVKTQDALLEFVRKANYFEIGCMSRDIKADWDTLIFYDEYTWKKFVDVFDILGFDFTTGEPDGEYKIWYIDFEFSDGIC